MLPTHNTHSVTSHAKPVSNLQANSNHNQHHNQHLALRSAPHTQATMTSALTISNAWTISVCLRKGRRGFWESFAMPELRRLAVTKGSRSGRFRAVTCRRIPGRRSWRSCLGRFWGWMRTRETKVFKRIERLGRRIVLITTWAIS
jgi:hypothetical protein